ncbi:MAG: hypothetical protein ACRCY8_10235 [Dermatophilaceae bacterium]
MALGDVGLKPCVNGHPIFDVVEPTSHRLGALGSVVGRPGILGQLRRAPIFGVRLDLRGLLLRRGDQVGRFVASVLAVSRSLTDLLLTQPVDLLAHPHGHRGG